MDYTLLNVRLRFSTKDKALDDFIQHHCSLTKDCSQSGDPDIYINLNKNTLKINKDMVRVSRNIWLGDSHVIISEIERFPGLAIEAHINENKLLIEGYFRGIKQSMFKKFLSLLNSHRKQGELQFIVLHYYFVLIPLFYYLEYFNGLFLLHASAIDLDGKGVLLSGLGGVGKSTFSLGMMHIKGSKFISDNLIFFSDNKVYPCPEPIALDNKSIQMITSLKDYLTPRNIEYSHDRSWYHVKPELISPETTPKYLFWLQQGNKNRVIPVEKENCIKNLIQINFLAKEVREYLSIAAALNLNFPNVISLDRYYELIRSLLLNVDCYVLQFKPGVNIETVISETVYRIVK